MTDALLRVGFAGPHVSVQDGGRPGFLRFGVPASGPLDRIAFRAANLALGNPPDAAGIEISPGGLALSCEAGAVTFALAGGGFILDHAGQRLGGWTVRSLRAGESLAIRPGPWGSWCSLAFAGELDVPAWLGSRATHALSGLGGGRIASGTALTIRGAEIREIREGRISCPVFARPRGALHVTPGPQERFFSAEAMAALLTGAWQVTDARDRMGMRLAGPRIAPEATLDMPSEPLMRGSVQVAGDGVATILLADHQPTGGYPRIATVLDRDLDALAQTRPGDRLRFIPVTPEAAIRLARERSASVEGYMRALARRSGTC